MLVMKRLGLPDLISFDTNFTFFEQAIDF